MNKKTVLAVTALLFACIFGCSKENKKQDRREASEMFERICSLTEEYTAKLETAPDSADWATLCDEFEERLDKISLSYPPDTDLLLTEGQNDTIHSLLQNYVNARKGRLHGLLHPEPETDTLTVSDSIGVEVVAAETTSGPSDASRSHGN